MNHIVRFDAMISTKDNYLSAEDINFENKKIISYKDGDTMESFVRLNPISSSSKLFGNHIVFMPPKDELDKIICTTVGDGIAFWVENRKKWVSSAELWIGDHIYMSDGTTNVVRSLDYMIIEGAISIDYVEHETFFINGMLSKRLEI